MRAFGDIARNGACERDVCTHCARTAQHNPGMCAVAPLELVAPGARFDLDMMRARNSNVHERLRGGNEALHMGFAFVTFSCRIFPVAFCDRGRSIFFFFFVMDFFLACPYGFVASTSLNTADRGRVVLETFPSLALRVLFCGDALANQGAQNVSIVLSAIAFSSTFPQERPPWRTPAAREGASC